MKRVGRWRTWGLVVVCVYRRDATAGAWYQAQVISPQQAQAQIRQARAWGQRGEGDHR